MTNVFCSSLSLMACKWKVANIMNHLLQKNRCNITAKTSHVWCEFDKMTPEELEPLLFSELEQLCGLHGKRLENKDLQDIVLAIKTIQKQMDWKMEHSVEATENIIKMVLSAPVHVQPISNTPPKPEPKRSWAPHELEKNPFGKGYGPIGYNFRGTFEPSFGSGFGSSTPSFFK